MRQDNKGFVQLAIIIILLVVILSLLGVSLSSLINNKTLKENFSFMIDGIVWVWENYIAGFASYLWDALRERF